MTNIIDDLIKKAQKIISDPIVLNDFEIKQVEKSLGICLPEDFKEINKKIGYESFNFFDYHNFGQGVIDETLFYREKKKLPSDYLILASDDVSFLLLEIVDSKRSKIIWCDCEDFFNLCQEKKMLYKPTVFNNLYDFYIFLLDEEKKERSVPDKIVS
jgi:hypothetical protein